MTDRFHIYHRYVSFKCRILFILHTVTIVFSTLFSKPLYDIVNTWCISVCNNKLPFDITCFLYIKFGISLVFSLPFYLKFYYDLCLLVLSFLLWFYLLWLYLLFGYHLYFILINFYELFDILEKNFFPLFFVYLFSHFLILLPF